MKNNGIIYALLSSLTFSIMNALVKATASSISSNEIVFFRSIIGTILILILMKKDSVSFSKAGIPILMLRGCCGAFYMIAYFYTISNMPLLDAILLVNMSPIFVLLFSSIFLKEKLPPKMYGALPIVFIGAILTIKPFSYSTFSIVAIFGILSAVFSGAAGVCIRFLSEKHHTYEIIFYFMLTATLTSIPLMSNSFVVPNSLELFYLICIGVVSLLAQVFLTKAFTHENPVVVEIIRYIGIVYNAFWGFAFFNETPDLYAILGGILIVVGCILINKLKQK
nr:DMT family transporter [Anaerophilus nitritogenes]